MTLSFVTRDFFPWVFPHSQARIHSRMWTQVIVNKKSFWICRPSLQIPPSQYYTVLHIISKASFSQGYLLQCGNCHEHQALNCLLARVPICVDNVPVFLYFCSALSMTFRILYRDPICYNPDKGPLQTSHSQSPDKSCQSQGTLDHSFQMPIKISHVNSTILFSHSSIW